MSEEYERYKKWWQSNLHSPVIDETKYKQIHGKEIESVFIDEANQLNDTINEVRKNIQEQQRLFQVRITIEDIIKAYKGEIDWNTYLKERHEYNAKIQEENNNKIFHLAQSEYKIEYKPELPILDFTTFSIAEALGKRDREGKDELI